MQSTAEKSFKEYDQLTIQGRIHPPLASPKIESEQPIYNYFVVNEWKCGKTKIKRKRKINLV
jgi:hypothetical protein